MDAERNPELVNAEFSINADADQVPVAIKANSTASDTIFPSKLNLCQKVKLSSIFDNDICSVKLRTGMFTSKLLFPISEDCANIIKLLDLGPNPMATLCHAENVHITQNRTRIPSSYFCTVQESEPGNVIKPLGGEYNLDTRITQYRASFSNITKLHGRIIAL